MSARPGGRKGAIVGAAAELFAVRGYGGVGVDDIGQAVGITGPAIYRHFKGKTALLDEVVLANIRAYLVSDEAAAEGIERIVADCVRTALEYPAPLATYVRERHRLVGPARDDMLAMERSIGRSWRDAIRAAAPQLDDTRITDRHFAVLTGMSVIATGRHRLGRPALDDLVSASMLGVLLGPVAPEKRRPRSATPTATATAPATPATATRRDEILAQALALFRERGFHGVGIDEVGEAAGVTGPTVYFHYDSKVDILLDAFERVGARVVAGMVDAVAEAGPPDEVLDRVARSYLDVATANVDLIVVAGREGDAVPEAARPRFAQRRRQIRKVWVELLGELRPDLGDAAVRTLVDGVFLLMNQLVQRGPGPAESVALVRGWCLGVPPQC